jgi:hypothetical protein
MVIEVNKNTIERYKSHELSPEYFGTVILILNSLYKEDYDFLDTLDDANKQRSIIMLYQYLIRKGFLEYIDEDDGDEVNYRLTERAVEFLSYINNIEPVVTKKDVVVPVSIKDKSEPVESWITSWIDLFPKGSVGGRYLRTKDTECADRMIWFIKEYGYDRDTIFKATKAYIQTQENSSSGHMYTRNSSYFIFKGRSKHDRTSDLATWCERVKNGDIEEIENDAFNKLV